MYLNLSPESQSVLKKISVNVQEEELDEFISNLHACQTELGSPLVELLESKAISKLNLKEFQWLGMIVSEPDFMNLPSIQDIKKGLYYCRVLGESGIKLFSTYGLFQYLIENNSTSGRLGDEHTGLQLRHSLINNSNIKQSVISFATRGSKSSVLSLDNIINVYHDGEQLVAYCYKRSTNRTLKAYAVDINDTVYRAYEALNTPESETECLLEYTA